MSERQAPPAKTRGPCEEVLIDGEWVIGMPEIDEPTVEPVEPDAARREEDE